MTFAVWNYLIKIGAPIFVLLDFLCLVLGFYHVKSIKKNVIVDLERSKKTIDEIYALKWDKIDSQMNNLAKNMDDIKGDIQSLRKFLIDYVSKKD